MEIDYTKISLYLDLFDLLRIIGLLPEYQNIAITIADDYTSLLYFNSNDSISTSKLRRILFKKYPYKIMPPRYTGDMFDQIISMLNNDIESKYLLWKDGINYDTYTLIRDQNEKYKLARIFYLSYEVPVSDNITKIELVHYTRFLNELELTTTSKERKEEILKNKQTYLEQTALLKNTVNDYNAYIRKIRRVRKKIKL